MDRSLDHQALLCISRAADGWQVLMMTTRKLLSKISLPHYGRRFLHSTCRNQQGGHHVK